MHGRVASSTQPEQPSLLQESARWARAESLLSIQEKCLVRRLDPKSQLRAAVPEPAKVVAIDMSLGEERFKYCVVFDKDLHQELVELRYNDRTV